MHVGSRQIYDIVLTANAFSRGVVLSRHVSIAGRTLLQTWQEVEDATTAVVEQEDAEIAPQVLVPQRILIVEETQVANDAIHWPVSHHREACRRGERALDTIDTPITPDGMGTGKTVGQADGRTVGVVYHRIAHAALEILHGCHLGISRLISIGMTAQTSQQFVPLLHKRVRFHDQHETDMISHDLPVALDDMRQVHEGVGDLARLIDHPGLMGFAKEALQPLAHDGASDIKHEVGHIGLIAIHQRHGLIEKGVHGLAIDQHRTLGLEEHAGDMVQGCWRDVG